MKTKRLLASLIATLLPCAFVSAETSTTISAYLNPSRGQEIGLVFEAFLSPQQEQGEEEDTPAGVPDTFRSTEPSRSRDQRVADGHRGHGLVRFTKDLSKAYVDIKLEATTLTASDQITMFHIHCGKPGILGPILIDFALVTDIYQNLGSDGILSVELTNNDITKNTASSDGSMAGALTRGCVIPSLSLESLVTTANPSLQSLLTPVKVTTIAGMATIAKQGDLYFNLHTTGQNYYGDMRGQWYPVEGGMNSISPSQENTLQSTVQQK